MTNTGYDGWHRGEAAKLGVFYAARTQTRFEACERHPLRCSHCRKGPHDDGFPAIFSGTEALRIGWQTNPHTDLWVCEGCLENADWWGVEEEGC